MTLKRTTIREVAIRAGVSTATVSNVLNNTKHVNKESRDRVETAARDLNYRVDRAASQLRSGHVKIIGMLVPDLEDAFFASLVSRLEDMARIDGYEVIVASSRDDAETERSRLNALLGWRLSGLIVVPCTNDVPSVITDEAGRLPIVLADRVDATPKAVDTVTIDNFEAGEIVARHLVAQGHRDILVAASNLSIAPIAERVRGVKAHLQTLLGLSPTVVEVGSNAAEAAKILERWLERNSLPTAVFGLTNVTTLGALSALANRRIEVPKQVSLVGFDDYTWMSARMTPLTAIRQPVDDISRNVWEQLMRRRENLTGAPQRIELTTTLEIRDSVRALEQADERTSGPPRPVQTPPLKKSIH